MLDHERCKRCKHPIKSHRYKVVTVENGRLTFYRTTWRCIADDGDCTCKFKTITASFKYKKPREE